MFWGLGVKCLGSREVKLTTHLHLVLKLRMSGANLCSPIHFFVPRTGTSLYNSFVHFTGLQICGRYWCCVCMATAVAVQGTSCLQEKWLVLSFTAVVEQADRRPNTAACHCLVTVCQQTSFCQNVQKIQLLFVTNEICLQFEKGKKFLSTG
jgi:hypothetical protein